MTKPSIPNLVQFVRDLSNKAGSCSVLTEVTLIITTDEGQYQRTIEVPGEILNISVANKSTNYSTGADKEIQF